MITTFKEVSETKTVDFCSLAAGACFYYSNTYTYYKKLFTEYTMDDKCRYNSIDLESGVLTFFCPHTKVKPYKKCEVILHE